MQIQAKTYTLTAKINLHIEFVDIYIEANRVSSLNLTNGQTILLFLQCHFLRLQIGTTAIAIAEACIAICQKERRNLRASRPTPSTRTFREALRVAKADVRYWKETLETVRGCYNYIVWDGGVWWYLRSLDPDLVCELPFRWASFGEERQYTDIFS